jgi:hypothetical protein
MVPPAAKTVAVLMIWMGSSQCRIAPLPEPDDCPPSLPGSSGYGALANVTSDRALQDNAPFRYAQRAMQAVDLLSPRRLHKRLTLECQDPIDSTADKYSNLSAQHRPHTTATDS